MPVPPPKRELTWSSHKVNWSSCTRCGLCGTRSRVILCRGELPCDVLFIGEAPGGSEDALGRPFAGPAGILLDEMVDTAKGLARAPFVTLAFTNLVGCIPILDSTRKTREPTEEEIKTCAPRVSELCALAKPKAIIMVGRLSGKFAPSVVDYDPEYSAEIIHPAAILRADLSQQGLAAQKTIIQISDIFKSVTNASTT